MNIVLIMTAPVNLYGVKRPDISIPHFAIHHHLFLLLHLHYSLNCSIILYIRNNGAREGDEMKKLCGKCASPVNGSICPVCGYDCDNEIRSVALTAGAVLDDRYVIGKVIGIGGFGITYLAYDTESEKTVAIKEYYPKGAAIRRMDDPAIEPLTSFHAEEFREGAEKFKNEADILSGLGDNKDIIKVYGTFGQNGTMYYVMEYVHGITINEYIQDHGKINEGQAMHIASNIAVTFGHIHSRNIIHRDLSPNNILLTVDGKVKLVDFGNARSFFPDDENSMTVSLKHGYAPLEQYQHHGNQGPWTDIYSLGAVLYNALTLALPNDPMTRLDNDMEFQGLLSENSPHLAPVINRMSAVKIDERYSCSSSLLKDLEQIKVKPQGFDIHISDK